MSSREFTNVDLTDHDPPVPGERERAAVRARAGQITRRRRLAAGAGILGAGALAIGLGSAALVGGGGGTAKVSVVVVQTATTSVDPGSTVTVELRNDDGSFSGVADSSGTVQFEHDLAPGSYNVFVTVDSPPGASAAGIDIGTARMTYSSPRITLQAGVNKLDLSMLHREVPH